MPIQAQSADGVIHEFPDGTDPSVIDGAMESYVKEHAPVGTLEDIKKTVLPSLERGTVAAATTLPTLKDLAVRGARYGLEKANPYVQSVFPNADIPGFFKATDELNKDDKGQDISKSWSYSNVQDAINKKYQETHGEAPYTAKTPIGKMVQSGLEFVPSAMATSPGSAVGAMVKGLLAGGSSEAAGQGADAVGHPEFGTAARIGGGFLGGSVPAGARKAVTPFPASAERTAAVDYLNQAAPGMPITASQKTGSPFLSNLEGLNKDSVGAPAAIKDLPQTQGAAFTQAAMRTMGSGAENALPANLKSGMEDLSNAYKPLIAGAIVQPAPFNTLKKEVTDIGKDYYKVAGKGNTEAVDQAIKDITLGVSGSATPPIAGILGPRYQFLRENIQNKIEGASTGAEKKALSDIRQSLDNSMYASLPPGQAEALKRLNTQYGNSKIIGSSKIGEEGHINPEALRNSVVANRGREAYNLDRGDLAPLARAGSTVLKPLEAPPHSINPLAHGVGAAAGLLYDMLLHRTPSEGILAGTFGVPALVNALKQNPAMAKTLFSKTGQSYLGNQAWKPGPGTKLDPALVARLLATSPQTAGQ